MNLEVLEELLAEATPQPWGVERGNVGAEHPLFVTAPEMDGLRPWCDADALIIAAAPALIAELRECREQLKLALDQHAELWAERNGWRARAEAAEAENARLRRRRYKGK